VLLAGGLTADASANYINLASPLQDGAHLHIPTQDEVSTGEADRIAAGSLPAAAPSAEATLTDGGSLDQKVNINTADTKQLVTLPGIGEALAKRIVDYRSKNGSFASVEDLKNVSGIGDKKFEELADKICV
jgi:competence protein ComEA